MLHAPQIVFSLRRIFHKKPVAWARVLALRQRGLVFIENRLGKTEIFLTIQGWWAMQDRYYERSMNRARFKPLKSAPVKQDTVRLGRVINPPILMLD